MTTVSIPSTGTPGGRSLVLSQGATDALYVFGLGALGLVGFRTVYGGSGYLLVGLIGLVLGIAVTELAQHWKQPVLAEAFVTVLLFLLIGGALAVPKAAVGGILPTENTLRTLGHVGLYGWKELLTAPPPVGNSFDLLALPYIVGLVGGVAGQSVARRTRSVTLPLLGPALILALGILFGARHPTSLALQGSLFGAVALSWMVIRYHRYRAVIAARRLNRNRILTSVALLVIAGAAAGVIGPHLPGSGRSRLVLSRYVVPPFEANAQPSPLAGFRQYATGGSLNKTLLFTVDGAEPGTMVRIATMDSYDGIVWGFGSDAFQRFGSSLPVSGSGHGSTEVTVHVDSLSGVWVPDIGQSSRISFVGKDATSLTSHFSYDPATATAAEPSGLTAGDAYVLTTFDPSRPSTQQLNRAAAGDDTVPISGVPAVVQADANQWIGSASSAWAKVMAIAGHLHSVGKYSDGFDPTVAGSPMISAPGHGAGRLTTFLEGGPLVGNNIVGDDEQYAAAFALMANAIGVPARVTLGAVVGADGTVRGSDVHAWVEVSLAGLGWIPISTSAFVPTTPAHETPPTNKPQINSSAPVEPPVVSSLHAPTGDLLPGSSTNAASGFAHAHRLPSGFRLPGWVKDVLLAAVPPVLLVAIAISIILILKRRRRTRRRRAPSPSSQIAGAWADLMDFARDLGHTVSLRSTRRQQAMALEEQQASTLAVQADAAVFAPGEPTESQVSDYWKQVEHFEASRLAGLSRWRQWRAALSLRSLRGAAGS